MTPGSGIIIDDIDIHYCWPLDDHSLLLFGIVGIDSIGIYSQSLTFVVVSNPSVLKWDDPIQYWPNRWPWPIRAVMVLINPLTSDIDSGGMIGIDIIQYYWYCVQPMTCDSIPSIHHLLTLLTHCRDIVGNCCCWSVFVIYSRWCCYSMTMTSVIPVTMIIVVVIRYRPHSIHWLVDIWSLLIPLIFGSRPFSDLIRFRAPVDQPTFTLMFVDDKP